MVQRVVLAGQVVILVAEAHFQTAGGRNRIDSHQKEGERQQKLGGHGAELRVGARRDCRSNRCTKTTPAESSQPTTHLRGGISLTHPTLGDTK